MHVEVANDGRLVLVAHVLGDFERHDIVRTRQREGYRQIAKAHKVVRHLFNIAAAVKAHPPRAAVERP